MSRRPRRSPVPGGSGGRAIYVAALALALLTFLAYSNSLRVPFLFDDLAAIPDNPTIRRLGDLGQVLTPPVETTVYGRPILNLSFALNYALGGTSVWGYHLFNILIHLGGGLALFGIVRRTLLGERLRARFATPSTTLAAAVAALWLLHPLQTESVTYIVQRAEALVGLFYFLTLYGALRSAQGSGSRFWTAAAILSCALGMGTKEVMATAPFLVLLYDRTFLAGTFRQALRARPVLHGALFATLVIVLALAAKGRPGSAGFGEGMAWHEYARTQPGVVLHYLRLAAWPRPLVFDYLWPVASGVGVALPLLLVLCALAGAAWLVWKNRPAGFAAAWAILILAPTSSVIPIVTEVAAEHRLYLPLAGLLALAVLGSHALLSRARPASGEKGPTPLLVATAVLALLFAALTFRRNLDYQSSVAIWTDTVEKRPVNVRAHYNLAKALEETGQIEEAVRRYREDVLRLKPDYAEAHANLGLVLTKMGQPEEAMKHFFAALAARPDLPEAHNNMAFGLARQGRTDQALHHYAEAVRLKPSYAEAHYNMANTLASTGHAEQAVGGYQEAVRLNPEFASAHFNLAVTQERLGRTREASVAYEEAIRVKPDYAKAHLGLGLLLSKQTSNRALARQHLETALRLQPDLVPARQALQAL